MLGSSSDAEDMVQDLFIGMHGYLNDNINNMKSYLSKMMINRCLNELKSARKKRVSYVERVLKILEALSLRFPDTKAQLVEVNDQQGILLTKEGLPTGVISFEWDSYKTAVQRIFVIVNPDKLKHLSQLSI